MKKKSIGLADDHKLLRSALASMINSFGDYEVILEASNGIELLDKLNAIKPHIILLDFNMPEMNGLEAAVELKVKHPDIHVLMLSMFDTELMLIKLLQAGVKGFMKKDVHPSEMLYAINSVHENGFYYSAQTSSKLAGLFRDNDNNPTLNKILMSETEIEFLKLSCTEMTYKEIASAMKINPRSIDGIRDTLFTRLDIKSRVGLAMYAIKHGVTTV
jgi:DNA-binding NarL/FixJ family response regulator